MIAGLLGGAALLLVLAGAAKVVDPSRTSGALVALGWPSSPWLVRIVAAFELLLGFATIVIGGPPLALLVAASYLGFAQFVMAALRAGTPVASCGCFGQVDTPPNSRHVAVNVALASGAVASAVTDAPGLVDASWLAWPVALVTVTVAYALLVFSPSKVAR